MLKGINGGGSIGLMYLKTRLIKVKVWLKTKKCPLPLRYEYEKTCRKGLDNHQHGFAFDIARTMAESRIHFQ